MIGKNIRYYRLMRNMSLNALAKTIGITRMAISNYENSKRTPDSGMIVKIAESLGVTVSDLLSGRNENLEFRHGEFRRNTSLTKRSQEFVRQSVEEYIGRFYTIIEILGDKVLPEFSVNTDFESGENNEHSALILRKILGFPENGPVGNLVSRLENLGILIIYLDIDIREFSGLNGTVGDRPYIAVNADMTPERKRFTIVHELVHMFLQSDQSCGDERTCNQIAGAFLLGLEDALRELGPRRTYLMGDSILVAKEYGISMGCLARRARDCGIVNQSNYENYCRMASARGWRKKEPARIPEEEPLLFRQLVYRAVSEEEISIRKGAEILKVMPSVIEKDCYPEAV